MYEEKREKNGSFQTSYLLWFPLSDLNFWHYKILSTLLCSYQWLSNRLSCGVACIYLWGVAKYAERLWMRTGNHERLTSAVCPRWRHVTCTNGSYRLFFFLFFSLLGYSRFLRTIFVYYRDVLNVLVCLSTWKRRIDVFMRSVVFIYFLEVSLNVQSFVLLISVCVAQQNWWEILWFWETLIVL